MSTRILVRHVKPGDRVLICGRPETVVRIETHGQEVHVFTPDDPSDPYLFTDADLISLLPRV